MKEKETKQTSFTDNLENGKSKNVKLKVAIALIILIVIIILLLLLLNRKVYTITFDSNGGSLVEPVTVRKNDTIPEPEDPTREGYVFGGWYYNDELYDFDTPVTSDMELEARWGRPGAVSGVGLNQKELILNVGDTVQLIATVKPESAVNKELIWESSNPDIVSVDENGNIKALKEGVAIITVTTKDGGYTATVRIQVIEEIVDEPEENKEESKKPGNNQAANNQPENNKPENNQPENNQPGDDEDDENETVVNVTGVSLDKTTLSLVEGQSSKLTATVNPSNATNKNVTWVSSNPNVVSVDSNGNVRALKEGKATITVTTQDGNHTATATITVKKASVSVTGVSLEKTTLSLTEGESSKLTVTVNPSNSTNKNVTWVSSNPDVVSVDSNGNIKALKPGSATITVTTQDGNYKATCQVTVNEKPASYTVIFTPIVQEGTNAKVQYSVEVTKNNSSFTSYKFVRFNETVVKKTLSSVTYNDGKDKGITLATIRLNDGSDVTATVLYK